LPNGHRSGRSPTAIATTSAVTIHSVMPNDVSAPSSSDRSTTQSPTTAARNFALSRNTGAHSTTAAVAPQMRSTHASAVNVDVMLSSNNDAATVAAAISNAGTPA